MKPKHKRLTFVTIALMLLGSATTLILTALEDNIVFFYSPSELAKKKLDPIKRLRIGGLVMAGSVETPEGGIIAFSISDTVESVRVQYRGILPDLFREGQGVVAEGYLRNGILHADDVLAKHDENYMPPEVAEALKKSGQWNSGATTR